MRLVHTHDPEPRDARILSNEEITSAIVRTHVRMWEFASLGEFQLAGVCERARDRMLDALSARLTQGVA
jgi:hypothetical protein